MVWLAWIRKKLSASRPELANGAAPHREEATADEERRGTIDPDNPISTAEQDTLGRAKTARAFAEHVLSLNASKGVVVGVLGPWGSGKTSFVNLARTHLQSAGIAVLEFNPWMFSGTEQLAESFFSEISAQLRVRTGFSKVGKHLEQYGETFAGLGWIPLVGAWIDRGRAASKLAARLLQQRKDGIGILRARVEEALRTLKAPLVVVVDDIDRLTSSEIRDIFKLVRLTASFPNMIYLLAFDRVRVEMALSEQGTHGRDYIEKILQVAIDIPAVSGELLNSHVFQTLNGVLSDIPNLGHFDEASWPDVYMEIIRPLLRNMRDVRRHGAAIRGTVAGLDGQIAVVDVMTLDAIRIFLPDVFRELNSTVEALTSTCDGYNAQAEAKRLKNQIERFIAGAGDRGDLLRALITRLFPAARRHIENYHFGGEWKIRWLRERRIAHEHILRLYLERVAGEGLQAFAAAEIAWNRMSDLRAFDEYLRSLDVKRLQDVISSLEAYEEDFLPEHVVPGAVVLLNLLPELPQRKGGMFELGSSLVVGRVVYRLVRSLKDPNEIASAFRKILPQVRSLSSRLELIDTVGYRENIGHKLVTEDAATGFENEWRGQMFAASADVLAKEGGLLWMLLRARRETEPSTPRAEVPESPSVTLAVLESAYSEVIGQALGSRAVSRSGRLAWKELIELYGGEDLLKQRIDALKGVPDRDGYDFLTLVDRYIAGWRPKDFGRE